MKIFLLNALYHPDVVGGAERVVQSLAESLVMAGHEVVVATLGTGASDDYAVAGVRVRRLPLRNLYWPFQPNSVNAASKAVWHLLDSYNPFMAKAVDVLLDEEKPDIVHTHNLAGFSSAVWHGAKIRRLPLVHTLHDQYLLCPRSSMFRSGEACVRPSSWVQSAPHRKPPVLKPGSNCGKQCLGCHLLRLPHRALSNNVSAVVGVSQFVLNRNLDCGYFRDVRLRRVIRNARDALQLGSSEPLAARDPSSGVRFGFIGRLDPTKGVDRLLEAFASLSVPRAELWIAGSSNKTDYEAALRAQGAQARVRFLGHVEPGDFYPYVDVVVVPSLWHDPLPGVVFEALAFGKPVIGSQRGGIPEMIIDGENGLLFEPDRPGDLLAALRRLADDRALRQSMSEAARTSALPFLDREGWVNRYVDLYAGVAEHTGRRQVA